MSIGVETENQKQVKKEKPKKYKNNLKCSNFFFSNVECHNTNATE